jgi:hypothetical protein
LEIDPYSTPLPRSISLSAAAALIAPAQLVAEHCQVAISDLRVPLPKAALPSLQQRHSPLLQCCLKLVCQTLILGWIVASLQGMLISQPTVFCHFVVKRKPVSQKMAFCYSGAALWVRPVCQQSLACCSAVSLQVRICLWLYSDVCCFLASLQEMLHEHFGW